MLEKRVFPLNNPLSQKSVHHQDKIIPVVVKKDEGVRQGGEGKAKMTTEEMVQEYQKICQRNEGVVLPVYMLLRCRLSGIGAWAAVSCSRLRGLRSLPTLTLRFGSEHSF